MADRSEYSRIRRSGPSAEGSPLNITSGIDQGNKWAPSYENRTYTVFIPQHNPEIYKYTQQPSALTAHVSSISKPVDYKQQEEQQYYAVPRPLTSKNPQINTVIDDPALKYRENQNYNPHYSYGYDVHAAHTHHSYPEAYLSSHSMSKQLTITNLQSHKRQTVASDTMSTWVQGDQHCGPWNAVGSVGKESEYEPYNTKL